jgi:hypothetical protein
MVPQGGFHYLNFNQKLFQIGETGTLGALTWGLAALGNLSHRTQFALLADELTATPAGSVMEVAGRWKDRFWPEYSARLSNEIARCKALHAKSKYDASAVPTPAMRTEKEERDYQQLKLGLIIGFCVAGYYTVDRVPHAFEILFDPLGDAPTPKTIQMGQARCWGVPKIFGRLVSGIDTDLKAEILQSVKWTGSESELNMLIAKHQLYNQRLPIRDAIDFVHACIFSTIKAIKSSHLSQVCGGPIELAVITTDRPYRWVRHKEWHAAIVEGMQL